MILYFPYTTEIFVFCQLLGFTHASWWWLAAFMLNDFCIWAGYKKHKGL
jgi:hypothetical protein